MACENALSGALSSTGAEDASETQFQMPKLDHANAPILADTF